jgi:hypothetical protein
LGDLFPAGKKAIGFCYCGDGYLFTAVK